MWSPPSRPPAVFVSAGYFCPVGSTTAMEYLCRWVRGPALALLIKISCASMRLDPFLPHSAPGYFCPEASKSETQFPCRWARALLC